MKYEIEYVPLMESELLIAPEGIEIKYFCTFIISSTYLLIAPEGIEIKMMKFSPKFGNGLLIAPEGIEIVRYVQRAQIVQGS